MMSDLGRMFEGPVSNQSHVMNEPSKDESEAEGERELGSVAAMYQIWQC